MGSAKTTNLKTAAIVLNWRRPDLTLSCLKSLCLVEGDTPDIYVVDNNSGDDSVARIEEEMRTLAANEPQRFQFDADLSKRKFKALHGRDDRATLGVIESRKNLGFGAGINLGIRAALEDSAIQLFWILNNDTVVRPDALSALKQNFFQDHQLGVLGSCLCYLDRPEIIQGVGGHYNPWLGTTRHVLGGHTYSEALLSSHRPVIDYAVGAAVCIRREVLKEAGLFPEDYFLYFEDLDWGYRVRKYAPAWDTRYTLASVVLHQEGGTTGANQSREKKTTALADYLYQRNRLRFSRRWHPIQYPIVHLSQIAILINRLKRREWLLACITLGLFIGFVPDRLKPKDI